MSRDLKLAVVFSTFVSVFFFIFYIPFRVYVFVRDTSDTAKTLQMESSFDAIIRHCRRAPFPGLRAIRNQKKKQRQEIVHTSTSSVQTTLQTLDLWKRTNGERTKKKLHKRK